MEKTGRDMLTTNPCGSFSTELRHPRGLICEGYVELQVTPRASVSAIQYGILDPNNLSSTVGKGVFDICLKILEEIRSHPSHFRDIT